MAHEYTIPLELIVKCKELIEVEKEQIEEDFIAGEMNNDSHHYTGRKIYQDEHDYYNKTYTNGL
jgi:hypothetical protein